MIARNRPEARLGEILRAWVGTGRTEPIAGFARTMQEALALDVEPVLVPSGRAALYFLFRAIPLRKVYLPAFTCWAVLEAARLADKDVALLDIDYPRLNLRLDEIERAAREPGIVVATHQFGFPEDVAALRERLGDRGHVIVEDCAGAMFTQLRGVPVGALGQAAIYSFEASKLWTLGRGGIVIPWDPLLAQRVRELAAGCTRGSSAVLARLALRRTLTHPFWYRLLLPAYLALREPTEGMQALSDRLTPEYYEAISPRQAQLGMLLATRLVQIVRRRQELFDYYHEAVQALPGITRVEALPKSRVTPIRYPVLITRGDKRVLYERLRADGIDLGFSYSYSLGDAWSQPGAARFAREVMNLPLYADLDHAAAERVIAALQRHLD